MSRCVRHAVVITKRIARKPAVRRTKRFVERHVVRSSLVSFVPAVMNDAVVHHKAVTLGMLLEAATDDVSVTVLATLVVLLSKGRF